MPGGCGVVDVSGELLAAGGGLLLGKEVLVGAGVGVYVGVVMGVAVDSGSLAAVSVSGVAVGAGGANGTEMMEMRRMGRAKHAKNCEKIVVRSLEMVIGDI